MQLALAAVWTEARRRGFALTDVVRWMSTSPAALVGLCGKGAIEVGKDADLVALSGDITAVDDIGCLSARMTMVGGAVVAR